MAITGMPSFRASVTAMCSFFGVDHEHRVGQALERLDPAEVALELLGLASQPDRLLLRKEIHRAREFHLTELSETEQALNGSWRSW